MTQKWHGPWHKQGRLLEQKHRGFTLIEMLVALSILTLVMLATVTGLRTLASTQSTLATKITVNDELRSVSSFLRDALESAIVGNDVGGLTVGGSGKDRTIFEAHPTRMMWKTTMLFGESQGGSFVVQVAREAREVVLRWQKPDLQGQVGEWNKAPSRTLVDNVQEFSVAYRREPDGEWQEQWDSAGAPAWVRLRIRAQERYWPDIVMAVAQ
ncbi:MAG: type II secretion system protein J [Congregibacter sp.]